MSEAVKLLNSLVEPYSTEEPHIIIDTERFITVPDELKRLGVQYDHNIETVTFVAPRYWDGHDLSAMNIYINYLRSDNTPGVYKVDNINVDDADKSIMYFNWTISKNITSSIGKIVFLVCAKSIDENGNEQNHWNSELCKDCYISEGLEVDGGISEDIRPDVIEQWYAEVTTVINDVENLRDSLIEMRDNGEFNGEPGPQGMPGGTELPIARGQSADGIEYFAYGDDLPEVVSGSRATWVGKGKQIIFVPDLVNSSEEPILSLNDGEAVPIRLRTAENQGEDDRIPEATTPIPMGSLMRGVPYTMTFCGKYWLVDSMIAGIGGNAAWVTFEIDENGDLYVVTADSFRGAEFSLTENGELEVITYE